MEKISNPVEGSRNPGVEKEFANGANIIPKVYHG